MPCCERGHTQTAHDGVRRTIPCRKTQIARVVIQMLQSRREYLLGSGDLVHFRMWTALVPCFMQGLPSDQIPALPRSTDDLIAQNQFQGPRDEENEGSGLCPLIVSALSGNLDVLNELVSFGADVNARLLVNMYTFGAERGLSALALAVAMCPQSNVYSIAAALLAAGANPNGAASTGASTLMAAVNYQSPEGVRALLNCARGLDLELKLRANGATALSVASFTSTAEIVEAMVQAGADRSHVEDGGGSKLTDACSNHAADVRMLEVLCRKSDSGKSLRDNINDPMRARTVKFQLIDLACRKAVQFGIGSSLLIMRRAHCQGATPLHMSAREGNVSVVKWLLKNGGKSSLHVKNAMGCLPIDLAGIFGPHVEVEGILGAAIFVISPFSSFLKSQFLRQLSSLLFPGAAMIDNPTPSSRSTTELSRRSVMKRLQSSQLQTARGGETAISMQYPMMLMRASDFIELSELQPHQRLRAAGKLVEWNSTMKHVLFLSHQWTSFEHPDHSNAQLRTVQKALARMIGGKLPKTTPAYADAIRLPSNIKIEPSEWQEIVQDAYIWMDYISVPQEVTTTYTELSTGGEGQASDLMKAVNSIPAYVERSSHFFAICPTVKFRESPEVVCDLGTWLGRGWCK